MNVIKMYKKSVKDMIDKAKLDRIQIKAYELKFEESNETFELGICISDGKDTIRIPTWKDESIEIVE